MWDQKGMDTSPMNRNYLAGRRFEYEVRDAMRGKHYNVVRASGSHGLYDLVAFRPDRKPEFVQCKVVPKTATADRLITKFKKTTIPSQFYHQSLYVKIKGAGVFNYVTV